MDFGDLTSLYQLLYAIQGREGCCTSTVTAREVDQRYFMWKLEDLHSGEAISAQDMPVSLGVLRTDCSKCSWL